MRVLFILTILFSFSFIDPQKKNSDSEKDIIVWNKDRLLTWDDFKGKPAKRFAVASTNYDIIKTIDPINGDTTKVITRAVFYCNKSWKKKSWIDETVLAHEQRHFDIVELYARKLRKLIRHHNYSSVSELKSKSDSLYAIIDKEMDVYQDKYDTETEGSMNGDQQRIWNEKIENQITELNKYADTLYLVLLNKK